MSLLSWGHPSAPLLPADDSAWGRTPWRQGEGREGRGGMGRGRGGEKDSSHSYSIDMNSSYCSSSCYVYAVSSTETHATYVHTLPLPSPSPAAVGTKQCTTADRYCWSAWRPQESTGRTASHPLTAFIVPQTDLKASKVHLSFKHLWRIWFCSVGSSALVMARWSPLLMISL